MKKKEAFSYLILVLHIIALLSYHHFAYIGHYGFDDIHYAKVANDLLQNTPDYSDHFTYRFPTVGLTALSFYIFGISDFAASLPALLAAVGVLLMLFYILKPQGNLNLSIGLSLTLFSQWFIFYSDKLMPDIYVAFSVTLACLVLYRFKFIKHGKRPFMHSLLFSLSLLLGFTAKETVVLILPWLLYVAVADIISKREPRFWLLTLLNGVVLLVLYFTVLWVITGSFASRWDALTGGSYLNSCSYSEQSFKILWERISVGFLNMAVNSGLITAFVFVFAGIIRRNLFQQFKMQDSLSFFLVSAIVLLLSCNFMSISPQAYNPMCLDVRHYLFIIPVSAIPAANIISRFVQFKEHRVSLMVILLAITLWAFFLPGDNFFKLYLPLFILFAIAVFVKNSRPFHFIFSVAFACILMVKPLDMVKYASEVQYRAQRETINEQILSKKEAMYVITDEVQSRLGHYYNSFKLNDDKVFLSFGKFNPDTLDNRRKLLLINAHTQYLSQFSAADLPYYAKYPEKADSLIFNDDNLRISILEKQEIFIPSMSKKILFRSYNDFEKPAPNWSEVPSDITEGLSYEGARSQKVNEYSSTLTLHLDSLQIKDEEDLIILASVYCYFDESTEAQVVVSIDAEEGNYAWESLGVNKYLKAYSHWWPVHMEVRIPSAKLQKGSVLKVFLWNPDKKKGYVDNFEVSIVGRKN